MHLSETLLILGLLVFLEGILSLDNALVLAILARPLPPEQRKRALTYGLVGALVFRLIAIGLATYLIRWRWVKYAGGAYLLWVGVKHFWDKHHASKKEKTLAPSKPAGFWKTVFIIELTDIAFAVDSILAAVALTPKFWLVFTGGFLGVVLMRFAATIFMRLLDRFPGFETTAYLLILVIGVKIILEAAHLPGIDFHSPRDPAFWVFWLTMAVCIGLGFVQKPKPGGSVKAKLDF